jgi:hypothetical protein
MCPAVLSQDLRCQDIKLTAVLSSSEVSVELCLCCPYTPLWCGYSELLWVAWSGDWIPVWAVDFVHLSDWPSCPPSPPVQWVQCFLPGGRVARACCRLKFQEPYSLVRIASVPLVQGLNPGRDKKFSVLQKPWMALWPTQLFIKGYRGSFPELIWWEHVNHWCPSSAECSVEVYLDSLSFMTWV